jgi:hypothetical protein
MIEPKVVLWLRSSMTFLTSKSKLKENEIPDMVPQQSIRCIQKAFQRGPDLLE